ncbi:carboxypeptidase-like regulatory domain-containing protein [Aquibacillus sediminis]|uniref:carboxypeptidase-like regulatory domain-containing protein n=1 Tax=Aquibacillus sediminis TaxID=2574734 RepID=UPI001107D2EE|nr:carboxypeptidase-like regulatory domain-containing protein [Aquibacillus sediminis]
MKVKLKIKHIIMIIVVVVGLAIGISQWVLPTLKIIEAEKSAESPIEETENFIDLLQNKELPAYKRKQIIEEQIINFGYDNNYDVMAGPASRQGPTLPLNSERTHHLEWYVDNNAGKDSHYYRAVNQLAYAYAKQGDRNQGIQLLSDTAEKLNVTHDDYWQLYKTEVELLANLNPDQAIQMIDKALEYNQLAADFTEIKVNLLINQEKYADALEAIKQTDVSSDQISAQERILAEWQEGEELHQVQGSITTSDGTPVPFAKVYLRLPNTINHSVIERQERHYTETDQDGNFTIAGVPKGYYQTYIGIDIQQIDGYQWPVETDDWIKVDGDMTNAITFQPLIKINEPSNYQKLTEDQVTFSWEPVEGAAYYRLGFGVEYENGSTSSPMMQRFEDNQVTLPVEQIYSHGTGVRYDENDEGELVVIPESLLAYANPNGDYFWYVEAFDEEGDLLTASNGFRLSEQSMGNVPYFQLQHRQLIEADQILLEGNLEEALETYQENLKNNPDNLHALRMVERILLYGDRENTSHQYARKQAMPYTKKLAEMTENNDTSTPDYWFDLATTAFEQEDWEPYFDYYQKGVNLLDGPVDSYSKSNYAIALMKNGQLQKVDQLFEEIMEADGSNRYMPPWTALRLYQTNDFQQAQQLASEYRRLGYQDNADWSQLIQSMEKQVLADPQKKKQVEQGLELYVKGNQHQLDQWLEGEAEGSIKSYFSKLNDL